MLHPNPLPCKLIVTVASPCFSKNGSFRIFILYGNVPEAVIVLPERTMLTFCVEEIGEDSSLCTGPEAGDGEGKNDEMPEQPLIAVNNSAIVSVTARMAIFFCISYR